MTCANSTISAVMRTTRFEREELFTTRRRLQEALTFLRRQGFKEEHIFENLSSDGYFKMPPARDELGLPERSTGKLHQSPPKVSDRSPELKEGDPFKDKMKGVAVGSEERCEQIEDVPVVGEVKRVWVQKSGVVDENHEVTETKAQDARVNGGADGNSKADPIQEPIQAVNEEWTEVKRKKGVSPGPECSPSPPRTFKNLKLVDEIDKRKAATQQFGSSSRLTKSQKKKLRLQKGGSPPIPGS
ncbi:hypothetical protein ACET3Z_031569 [Daucus carota]